MNTDKSKIRTYLAAIIRAATPESTAQATRLARDAGLTLRDLLDTGRHGVIDATDLIALCRALGLDAADILTSALHNEHPDYNPDEPIPYQFTEQGRQYCERAKYIDPANPEPEVYPS